MAYTSSSTLTKKTISGRRYYLITITETEAAATSEHEISMADAPQLLTVVSVKSTLTAGTGTTIDPRLGRATGWADNTQDAIFSNGTAAASIDTQPGSVIWRPVGQNLFWKATPNDAAADHSISTEILCIEGFVDCTP